MRFLWATVNARSTGQPTAEQMTKLGAFLRDVRASSWIGYGIFEYTVHSLSIFSALSLVSCYTRVIVTQHGLSNMTVCIVSQDELLSRFLSSMGSFSQEIWSRQIESIYAILHFLLENPDAGPRIRYLRLMGVYPYESEQKIDELLEVYHSLMRSCVNLTSLSTTTTALEHNIEATSILWSLENSYAQDSILHWGIGPCSS